MAFKRFSGFFSADDDEKDLRRMDAKRERILHSIKTPILPGLSTFLFWIMIGSTFCALIGETGVWIKYDFYGVDAYLKNLSVSLLCFWSLSAFVVIVLSGCRFYALKYGNIEPLKEVQHEIPLWHRGKKKTMETPERYARRCAIALGGIVIFFLFMP